MPFSLDSYQLNAVRRLRNGCILCGGVGSGKSRTALAYYYSVVCGGSLPLKDGEYLFGPFAWPRDLYIITTAKKRDSYEWLKELSDFHIFMEPEYNHGNIRVCVDSWNNIKKYVNTIGAFFIFDEQKVTGSGAWVKAFYQIAKKNKWILLSATPGDNWLDYIPVFVANGFYRNKTEFIRRHVVYSAYANYPKVQEYLDVKRLIYLKNKITVTMDYNKPTEVHEDWIRCTYDSDLYSKVVRNRWNPYKDEPIQNVSEYCAVLRRITNSTGNRIQQTKRQIMQYGKLIIFYNFDYELEELRQACKDLNMPFAEWNGHKHMPIPSTDEWVYLVQYAAGAEAWECTDTNAMLFFSQSYSYKQTEQAKGRIDRRSTPFHDLYYVFLICPSDMDKVISKCLSQKKDFNENKFVFHRGSQKKHGI